MQSSRILLVAGAAFLLCAAGCRPRYGGDTNAALGVPLPGSVRILTTRIGNTPDTLHYKWSAIGSVNWRKASANGGDLSIEDTYPLNSTTEHGGCNVYEADLTANAKTGKWDAVLHGSYGDTVRSSGSLPAGKPLSDAVHILQDGPAQAIGTPAQIPLATIGDTTLRLNVAP